MPPAGAVVRTARAIFSRCSRWAEGRAPPCAPSRAVFRRSFMRRRRRSIRSERVGRLGPVAHDVRRRRLDDLVRMVGPLGRRQSRNDKRNRATGSCPCSARSATSCSTCGRCCRATGGAQRRFPALSATAAFSKAGEEARPGNCRSSQRGGAAIDSFRSVDRDARTMVPAQPVGGRGRSSRAVWKRAAQGGRSGTDGRAPSMPSAGRSGSALALRETGCGPSGVVPDSSATGLEKPLDSR